MAQTSEAQSTAAEPGLSVFWANWYILDEAISLQVAKGPGFFSGVYLMVLAVDSRFPLVTMAESNGERTTH